ncbi:hypothetical protein MMC16_001958 [Acarospora aff. strigata]|nr:hypothetical protein [Acarospora aff. strigata]
MSKPWTPPAPGSPVWLEIPALDVERAKTFYATIFDWVFQPGTADYPADKHAMFAYPGCKTSGGIMRVDDETKRASMQRVLSGDDGDVDGVVGEGKAGAGAGAGMTTYFYVSNIEDAVERIEKAGGKIVRGRETEGKHGWHAVFMDTEGNRAAVYTWKEVEGCAE